MKLTGNKSENEQRRDSKLCMFIHTNYSHSYIPAAPTFQEFYILLTVHLDVIVVNDQLDALFLNVFISCLYMFRAQVLISRRAKLY
jgi:hypothetical protein